MKKILGGIILIASFALIGLLGLGKSFAATNVIEEVKQVGMLDAKCRFLTCGCKPKIGFICIDCASCQQD